ncbi:MAG: hypothetical protein K1X92_17225 [Bacteroidia bacterium]|nr:hypothetical protein [Bacteroidia bacterium]
MSTNLRLKYSGDSTNNSDVHSYCTLEWDGGGAYTLKLHAKGDNDLGVQPGNNVNATYTYANQTSPFSANLHYRNFFIAELWNGTTLVDSLLFRADKGVIIVDDFYVDKLVEIKVAGCNMLTGTGSEYAIINVNNYCPSAYMYYVHYYPQGDPENGRIQRFRNLNQNKFGIRFFKDWNSGFSGTIAYRVIPVINEIRLRKPPFDDLFLTKYKSNGNPDFSEDVYQ